TYTVNVVDATVPAGKALTTSNDPTTVNLGPGENRLDVDFGYMYNGSIGDYVWCDDNGDGIQDATEAPIAGVVIELLDALGNVIATDTTDANGLYLFDFLPPATYTVNVVDATVPAGKDLTTNNDPTTVNLGPGENRLDVDFGYMYNGTIGDYVWCDENLDGIQDASEPAIAGVVLELLDAQGNVIATDTTDANGLYLFTDLGPGQYTVNVVDATTPVGKELTTNNDPLVVNLGPGENFLDADFGYGCVSPTLSANVTDVSCAGGADGAIDLTITGGTGPNFTVLWSNGATTEDLFGLSAGTYSVTVTGDGGCTASASFTVIEPDPLVVTTEFTLSGCSETMIQCPELTVNSGNCDCDGKMQQVTVVYQGTSNTVTVYDKDGTTALVTFNNVSNGDTLVASSSTAGMSTFESKTFWNDGTGNIEIHTSCSQDILYQTYGSFFVTGYVDGAGNSCGDSQDPFLGITLYDNNCGCESKMIEVSFVYDPSGTPNAKIAIYDDGKDSLDVYTSVQPGDLITVSASDYGMSDLNSKIFIRVNGGAFGEIHTSCSQEILGSVVNGVLITGYIDGDGTECNALECMPSYIIPTASCECSGGMIEVTTIYQGSSSTVYVKDGSNTLLTFNNVNTGDTLTASASAAGLSKWPSGMDWKDGSGTVEIHTSCSDDIVGETYGSFYVIGFIDNNGNSCSLDNPYSGITLVDPNCGCEDKMTEVSLIYNPQGSSNATIEVYDGSTVILTFNNVQPGDEIVLKSSDAGMSDFGSSIDISVNNGPLAEIHTSCSKEIIGLIVSEVLITGYVDGMGTVCDANATMSCPTYTAEVTATGGTPPYTYSWSNGSTASSISDTLCSSTSFTVTVTDGNGCIELDTIDINIDAPIVASFTTTDVSCNGTADGSATVMPMGGQAPYTYIWSNGATTATISNLAAGIYTVTITDDNGCEGIASVCIKESSLVTLTVNTTDADCGVCNGTATASVAGGDSTYTYLWDNGATTATIDNLCPGKYNVTVSDGSGCSATASAIVGGSSDIVLTTTSTDDGCGTSNRICDVTNITSNARVFWLPSFLHPTKYYAADATIGLQLEEYADGTARFHGRIVNIGNTANGFDVDLWFKDKKDYTDWIAGGGSVKTFDPANDPTTWEFYVFDNSKSNTLTGFGALSGESIVLTDKAGMNYGIQVGFGANDKTFTYGISTWFDYTGTSSGGGDINGDLNNCTNVSPQCAGTASVSATGGNGSYSYIWSNGATTPSITGLCAGMYSVTVSDSTGCFDTASVVISGSDSLDVMVTTTNVSCDSATSCNPTTILEWDMEACAAGSKYSEFYATKVLSSAFDKLTPTNLYRSSGDHSCTPGVNGGTGMCVGTDSKCTFDDNDPYALRFNVTLGPKAGESASLTGFTFYEKAPSTYVWTSGGSGANDYPTKYGIRVLKDGVEIFKQVDIATSQNWALQSFDFSSIPGFTVNSGSSVFSFELRAYCRAGVKASYSVWDLDNFAIEGCSSSSAGRSCDGTIALNVNGGSGSYTYNWLNTGTGGSGSVSKQISAANNDAEEYPSTGNSSTAGLYHSMGTETIGLRFDKLQIPANAIITSAHIEFTASDDETGAASLTIVGEDADNSAVFDGSHQDISSRSTTSSTVQWNNPVAWYTHKQYNSPDISSIVQEVVDRAGWNSGNPVTVIISGTGEREAKSYDNYPAKAPKLIVQYTVPTGTFNGPNASDLCAGTYCVIITDDVSGCSSNVCITVGEDTCGTPKSSMRMAQGDDATDLKVAAYPNPTRGLLNVAIESTTNTTTTVKVYDLIGNEVYSRTVQSDRYSQIQIDLSRLSVGMYMLEVESDGQRVNKQLILSSN
ncbi:MAG: T9SS type A sorting domain-containing protein, partial [Bacteroidia bacterium]|nr:T9SS type A sorting domain-containing protein [Bacteroidia bacterium]